MNPLAELNNLTFEILNPMGYLYNQTNDDLNVISIIHHLYLMPF